MPRFLTLAVVFCLVLSTVALSAAEQRANKHKARSTGHKQHARKSLVPTNHRRLEEVTDYVVKHPNAQYLFYTMTWEDLNYVFDQELYIRFGLLAALRNEATNRLGRGTANYMGRPEIFIDRIFHTEARNAMVANDVLEYVADRLEVTQEHKVLHARAAMIHAFQEGLLEAATAGLSHHVGDSESFAFLVASRQTEAIQTFRALPASPWGAYINPLNGNTNAVAMGAPTAMYQDITDLGADVSRRNLEVAVAVQGIRAIRQHMHNTRGAGLVPAADVLTARLTDRAWMVAHITPLVARLNALTRAVAELMDATTCDEAEIRSAIPPVVRFVDFTYPTVNEILENALAAIATMDDNLSRACDQAIRRGELEAAKDELDEKVSVFRKLAKKFSSAFS